MIVLVLGWIQLAGTQYKTRQNNMAKYIHWLRCGKRSMHPEEQWWRYCHDSVIENDSVRFSHVCRTYNISKTASIDKASSFVTYFD